MVNRMLEQKEAVMRILSTDRKSDSLKLNWQALDVLESMVKALEKVAPLTDALSGERVVTISDVIPVLDSIERVHLKRSDDDTNMTNEIRTRVLDTLFLKYRSFSNIHSSDDYHDLDSVSQVLLVATFLDPRYKAAYCALPLLTDLLFTFLVKDGHLSESEPGDEPNSDGETQAAEGGDCPAPKQKKTSVLQSFIQNRAAVPEMSASCRDLSLKERLDIELKIYTADAAAHAELASYVLTY